MIAKIISIVSGKGGSGKSLMTAVLGRALGREGERVLIVDMDIFVRGLTVLLFGFHRPDRRDGLVTVSDLLGVFSEHSKDRQPVATDRSHYMIQRFFECDVLPAVDNIAAPLDYDDRSLSDEGFASSCIRDLINSVQQDYDYILLDNRAGMDSLIAASCRNANIVLTVAEDDEVGRQTNVNLIRFLQQKKNIRIVYTILNKGRNIRNYSDIKKRARDRFEYAMLGVIPFDIEILEDFGSDRFWVTVMQTLYFRALIDAWNELAKAENLRELLASKYAFPPRIFMRQTQGRFSLIERMLRTYSLLFLIGGAFVWMYRQLPSVQHDPASILGLIAVAIGVLAFWISTSGILASTKDAQRKDE